MIEVLQYLAVITPGLFGVLMARAKGMDAVGVCWVAFIIAFGGGTLRDLLLDRQPLFWIEHEHYTWRLSGIAVVGAVIPRLPTRLEGWLLVPDALGLALFSVVGAGIAVESGPGSLFIASLFGVITGAFGGVIADVLCIELPRLFMPSTPLYSVCAFVGRQVYLLLRALGVEESVSLPAGVVFILLLRLAAVRWHWTLSSGRSS
jgi:uncharacterized membrane protein YeiH